VYRDDLEAMVARALSLEHDAERLKARIAELELDNAELRKALAEASAGATAPPVKRGKRQLTIAVEDANGPRQYLLDDAVITIGGSGTHVPIDHTKQVHALLANSSDGLVLADAGTPIGIHVNGEEIRVRTLREGDQIIIGHARIAIAW
jgi:hypothetical protein